MAEAERADRRFDVVICEEIARIGRRSYISTEIEHRLEQAGVLLVASDEPFRLEGVGGRRVKTATQQVAERRELSRSGGWANTHPATTRTYRLRSYPGSS
jgi:DNA invertase Pin-like site-specific DNA recombinase